MLKFLSKLKVTKLQPTKVTDVGNKYTVQVYPDGTTTVGIKGKKPGHFGGKGNLQK